MKFGPTPLAEAEGAVLAHSVATPEGRLRKGTVLDAGAVARLRAAGLSEVIAARLEPGDVGENPAAARLAAAICGDGLELREAFTGRANLHAEGPGILRVDAEKIAAANAVDPTITVATLPEWQRVTAGMMAATVKIIAYAVDGAALDRACAAGRGALSLARPVVPRADLIVTELDGAADGAEAVAMRLDRLGIAYAIHRVPHTAETLRAALAGCRAPLRLVLTASATSDIRDVGPAALVAAGGRLTRFGMPVDPGNLLFLGTLDGAEVIGLPGCARSPALNGADWVLERVACGVPVGDAEIAAMGVGGLLKEIPTRPQPRERRRRAQPRGDAAK
ncbi:molybdopterin-binding protein [Jannaschia ovalis]|uniref:Molybdopterin-binding protein n=1 Tax=Jannaschia ovalis TaxID=3038773 RepID=A0ABY8LAE7_9RHOB|nr:molybdopterin-binding protein [Jannaschia sp. GRR-S6-38]WGH78106.1 molybdopterin-binding protein [Jannaschia sp. GRR-S6-38]